MFPSILKLNKMTLFRRIIIVTMCFFFSRLMLHLKVPKANFEKSCITAKVKINMRKEHSEVG